ncbi:MAG: molybdopterin-guanine dinucleotide biosynthesis protein B [Rhodospirillales bacterium]|jgi:molybdopterin-guanine dinucleotide biosynthesis protein B|nr:molybdopterin-guanine dinucleotide biosynthesis protein B [Rhodospirillales bacterium]MDP7651353.1 molybdopterin-guanine dinucleotide biosynthesis protein B [Rhodospirillales bacterium]|tara:strand:+ start:158 stop:679 length:522 start_codon:yes stop_codon:yes gene_type:complete
MKVFGLIGWSNAGKTTLMINLLPELIGRGIKVSTMKHGHHDFEIDKAGKDSYRHREAGATEVLLTSASRWALMHELRGAPERSIENLISHMTPVDLLLIEGFKTHRHVKLEIHRPAEGKPLICRDDPDVVAVASDQSLPDVDLPVLDLNDIPAIADFILSHCEIKVGSGNGEA